MAGIKGEKQYRTGRGDNGWVKKNYFWIRWAFPVIGLLSLVWFLVRVAPKPTRAAYPCQRVAGSLAGGFLVWIAGMVGSVFAYRQGKQLFLHSRLGKAALCFAVAMVAVVIAIERMPEKIIWASAPPVVNDPIGVARGIHPGRVVWVHDPNVSSWTFPGCDSGGFTSTWNGETGIAPYGYWYDNTKTHQAVVDQMLADAIKRLAGEYTEADAWDAMIRHFKVGRGEADEGYQAGEKFMIKINLTNSNRVASNVNGSGDQYPHKGLINTSPQIVIAVLRQLVNVVGVAQSDITVGDTSAYFPNHYWDLIHPEFPDVRYLDCAGLWGRVAAQSSQGHGGDEQPIDWSTSAASGYEQDYLPLSYSQAEYLINIPALKGHAAGVTLCGKNHFGSLIRLPDPTYLGDGNYYTLHHGIPGAAGWYSPGMGFWRPMVDMMGHVDLGAKTLLYLIDGFYAGYHYQGQPYRWNMAPFNGWWPSSLFASMDPVAIDSVAYDFLEEEWPDVVSGGVWAPGTLQGGAEDYLHEAALADDPCSGTVYDPDGLGQLDESLGVHEHWNNPTDKEYTRNLETGDGIELFTGPLPPPPPPIPACWNYLTQCNGDVDGDGDVDTVDWPVFRDSFGYAHPSGEYHPCGDMDHDGDVDTVDWPSFRDNFGHPAPADCTPGGTWPPL